MVSLKVEVLYEELSGKRVRCIACARRCVIEEGRRGFCGVRENKEGSLHSLVYGKPAAVNADPILKKPLDFFNPGSTVLSIGTVGCNFRCQYCCNWSLSQETEIIGADIPPKKMVEFAERYRCQGISYTYNEPTVFIEYTHDIGVLAKQKGLFNTYVTNGYLTPEAVEYVSEFLDAATVDFKASGNPEFYKRFAAVPDVEPIYECVLELKKRDVHIEITNLVVPKYGDSLEDVRALAEWIRDKLGRDTPFHLLRFHPNYRMVDLPSTPVSTLEKACEVAMEVGLRYVLIGNVPGHRYENTYCPGCGKLIIGRYGFAISKWELNEQNRCNFCGYSIPVRGKYFRGGMGLPLPIL